MKKLTAILLAFIMLAVLISGCGDTPDTPTTPSKEETTVTTPADTSTTPEETSATTTEASTAPEETTAPLCTEHTFGDSVVTRRSTATVKGETKKVCTKCGAEEIGSLPTSIKILAVGNSFSVDAMEYLYDMLDEAGVEEIVLGNLYVGGCTLDGHQNNMEREMGTYVYYTNLTGKWTQRNSKASTAIAQYDWDYITLQQGSHESGRAQSFRQLDWIADYLIERAPEHCKLVWHMTWAYQQNCTYSYFANYGKNQMTMYDSITACVEDIIMKNEKFIGVIPCGTSVQNLRTSYIGDTITRDGYHMSYAEGRYVTALTWFTFFTGLDPETITWMPGSYTFDKANLAPIREAVKNAMANPLDVTKSKLTTAPQKELAVEALTEEDIAALKAGGYDPAKYSALVLDEKMSAYYNSTSSTPSAVFTGQSNSPNFYTTRIFQKGDLKNGTLIYIEKGYQYRPEGWKALSTQNASAQRPANETGTFVTVSDAWWGSFNYRAFNISATQTRKMTNADIGAFRIYVLK